MNVGHCTAPGKGRRRINEDSLFVDEDLGLFIVADGMGGHNAGEVASRIAVDVTAKSVRQGLAAGKKRESVVRQAIAEANASILEKSLNNPAWEEMGTTLVMALVIDREVVIGHVGDSRAYMIHGGQVQLLTNDHTFVFEWMKEGLITREQARKHRQRHGLTEALGVSAAVEEEVSVWPWADGTCLLLCSDGLTDILDDQEVLEVLEISSGPQQACMDLVHVAKERGGTDDITVILVCA